MNHAQVEGQVRLFDSYCCVIVTKESILAHIVQVHEYYSYCFLCIRIIDVKLLDTRFKNDNDSEQHDRRCLIRHQKLRGKSGCNGTQREAMVSQRSRLSVKV